MSGQVAQFLHRLRQCPLPRYEVGLVDDECIVLGCLLCAFPRRNQQLGGTSHACTGIAGRMWASQVSEQSVGRRAMWASLFLCGITWDDAGQCGISATPVGV